MRFTIGLAGDQQVDRTLVGLAERVNDWRPAFDRIAELIKDSNVKQFQTEGKYGGRGIGWAPLEPGYKRWKARHYPGAKILVRTGRLRRALTERPFATEKIGKYAMTVGVGDVVPYAKYHQRGTPRLVRRRPLELTPAVRNRLVKMLHRFAVTGSVD